jgi:hypothetical protein
MQQAIYGQTQADNGNSFSRFIMAGSMSFVYYGPCAAVRRSPVVGDIFPVRLFGLACMSSGKFIPVCGI